MVVPTLLVLAPRWLLAGVFGIAGLSKLGDLQGFRRALWNFGLPGPLIPLTGTLLPWAELAVACGLLPEATAAPAAVAAFVLLAAFAGGIGINLAKGRTPDCRCFGQLHSAPADWKSLARNVALALLSLWLLPLTARERASVGGGAFGLVLLISLIARRRVQPNQASRTTGAAATAGELPIGSPAPAFSFTTPDGRSTSLETLRRSAKPVVLVFSVPDCGPCRELEPNVDRWRKDHAEAVTLAIVSDREVMRRYGVLRTPAAVLVGPDGTIGSAVANGEAEISMLVLQAAGRVMPDAVPTQQKSIQSERLQGGGLVLSDADRQHVRTLNVTAAFIWECCDGDHSVEAIIGEVREVFPQAKDLERDVRLVLGKLLSDGMISLEPALTSTGPIAGIRPMES